ncbi:MAG: Membrane-bound lytic murein transglycosylase C precursor [Alphaproteobacteria bacterium ADurb.BinA280]|nr:MAG: Membrane-bound lytic murein transglycosylase C precursor [Alphaproteobacteria bacterium ADurb.BinA280]
MTLSRMTLPRFQCVCLQGIKWHLTSWGLACCLCWIPSATLWAGDLYRCVGPQGETAFTSDRSGFRDCHVVKYSRSSNSGSLAASASKPVPSSIVEPAPATTAPSQSPVRVDFRTSTNLTEPVASTPPTSGSRVSRGAVYRYVKDGVTHYTNRRPAGQRAQLVFSYIETCYACSPASQVDFNRVGLNTTAFANEIRLAGAAHGVEEALVRAVIHAESAFNFNALSNKGAQGLMQLMPATAARFGVVDPFSAEQNISGGTAYLAWLLKRFKGDVSLAVAGYNAGEGAVDRFGGVPPYEETQVFVERVGVLLQRYREQLTQVGEQPLDQRG